MKLEDIETNQIVRLHIDKTRYPDPLDLAYLMRETPNSKDEPPIDGEKFLVGDISLYTYPKPHVGITLHEIRSYGRGRKAYLAFPHELELVVA